MEGLPRNQANGTIDFRKWQGQEKLAIKTRMTEMKKESKTQVLRENIFGNSQPKSNNFSFFSSF